MCALAERDGAAATQALSALNENEISLGDQVPFNRRFVEGLIARMTNDERNAQLAFAAARAEQEKIVEAQPDFGPAWCVLGMIDAGLGRKEEALREGRRALELLPAEKEALVGRVPRQILCSDCSVGWRKRSRLRTACCRRPAA